MTTLYRLVAVVTALIATVGLHNFQALSQPKEYSPYECYNDWMIKVKDFYEWTENENLFLNDKSLDWVTRCIGYEKRDPNEKDSATGRTALHLASRPSGAIPVMRYLLRNGSNVNAKDDSGVTPIFTAINRTFDLKMLVSEEVMIRNAKFLLDHGADPNAKDNAGNTPLLLATDQDLTGLMRLLIDYGAKVNLNNDGNLAPVHFAADSVSPLALKILLDNGAKMNVRTKKDITIQHLHPGVLAANPGKPSEFFEIPDWDNLYLVYRLASPLHLFSDHLTMELKSKEEVETYIEVCKMILEAGVNPKLKNGEGRTAYDISYYWGNKEDQDQTKISMSHGSRECARLIKEYTKVKWWDRFISKLFKIIAE